MFRSSHHDYTYFEDEENSDSDSILTGVFTEASETDGSTGTDYLVIGGPKTPEQQIALIKNKLESGNMDTVALERLMDQLTALSREGVPSGLEDEFNMLINQTSNVIGNMGNVIFSSSIYTGMADLGIAPKHLTPAPEVQQIFTPAPAFGMTG